MVATTAASPGPRYAPEDPSLPKPWRGLVDGKTGYLYFWNPETNVTQYERPGSAPTTIPSRPTSYSSGYVASSPQIQDSSYSKADAAVGYNDNDRDSRGSNEDRTEQSTKGGNTPNEAVFEGFTRELGSGDAGSGLSAEAYRRRHEISVSGSGVPSPFMTFDVTGFPSEILKEMRYLLQEGAKCRTLCCPLLEGFIIGVHFNAGPIF